MFLLARAAYATKQIVKMEEVLLRYCINSSKASLIRRSDLTATKIDNQHQSTCRLLVGSSETRFCALHKAQLLSKTPWQQPSTLAEATPAVSPWSLADISSEHEAPTRKTDTNKHPATCECEGAPLQKVTFVFATNALASGRSVRSLTSFRARPRACTSAR